MELKRILWNRRFFLTLFFLLVVNGWYVWRAQQLEPDRQKYFEEHYDGDYQKDARSAYQRLLTQYQKKEIAESAAELSDYYKQKQEEEQKAFLEGTWQEPDSSVTADKIEEEARSILYEQITYINGYDDYLKNIETSAEKMRNNASLGTKGSFSRRNIDKTVKDFKPLENISLSLENEKGIDAYADCSLSGFLLIILMAAVVLILLEERKRGLWQFIYAMPGGRCRLAFIRCAGIFAAAAIGGILLEAENLLVTGWLNGGMGDLSRAVQSNPQFAGCTLPVSMGTFLLLAALAKILVSAFIGMLLWAAASSVKNHMTAFVLLAAVIAGEYYAYAEIAMQSSLNRFKYINLFAFLDSAQVLTHYQNVNILDYPVSPSAVLLYVLPAALILAGFLVVLLGKRKPFSQQDGFLKKMCGRLIYCIKPYRHGSLLFHESYKVYIQQKAGIIFILLIFCTMFLAQKDEIFYDYATTLYHNYMEQIAGKVTEEKLLYLESEHKAWQRKTVESEQKIEEYGQSEEFYLQYDQEEKRLEQLQIAGNVVSGLMKQGERLQELAEKGSNAGFVEEIGYEMYLGKAGDEQNMKQAFLMLAFLVASLSGIQSFEKSQNAWNLVRSTQRGRKSLYCRKIILCLFTAGIITACITIGGFLHIYDTYGMRGFSYSVYSLEQFADFPFDISIGGMLAFIWVLRWLLLASVSLLVLFLSGRSRNMIAALFVNVIIFLIPAGLVYMGFSVVSVLSVLRPLTVTWFWNTYGFSHVMGFLPAVFVLGLGIAAGVLGGHEKDI